MAAQTDESIEISTVGLLEQTKTEDVVLMPGGDPMVMGSWQGGAGSACREVLKGGGLSLSPLPLSPVKHCRASARIDLADVERVCVCWGGV